MKYIDPNWQLKNHEKIIAEESKQDADGLRRGYRIRKCKECGLCYETAEHFNKFRQPRIICPLCRCEKSETYKQICLERSGETWEAYYARLYKKGLRLQECLKREYKVLGVKVTNERITTRLSLTK